MNYFTILSNFDPLPPYNVIVVPPAQQTIVDDMHEQVYSLVASDKAKDTIGILLDMHLLEDEQVLFTSRSTYLILLTVLRI